MLLLTLVTSCLLQLSELVVLWFFFFFQAEDGIRDIGVTGVQTCDLPISLGKALGAQDKTGDALAEYRKAVDLNQNPALAHRWLGGALLFHGKTEEALGELRTAIGLDPENAYGVIWLY